MPYGEGLPRSEQPPGEHDEGAKIIKSLQGKEFATFAHLENFLESKNGPFGGDDTIMASKQEQDNPTEMDVTVSIGGEEKLIALKYVRTTAGRPLLVDVAERAA